MTRAHGISLILSWITLVLIPIAGCGGSDRAHVSGTVIHKDGSPLIGARIVARSRETGHTGSGVTNDQGFYTLGVEKKGDGMPPGNYYVIIREDRGDYDYPNPPTIASKYSSASDSGFSFEVAAGEAKTFDLTADPP
jgi:Carboxypeptidase regulatory-like domain